MKVVPLLVVVGLALGACGGESDRNSRTSSVPKSTHSVGTPSATPQGVAGLDESTKAEAGEALDKVLYNIVELGSGEFSSYVNFQGMPMKTEGRFDLVDEEFEALMTAANPSAPEEPLKIRYKVLGEQNFVQWGIGPAAKCWMRFTTDSLLEMLPDQALNVPDMGRIPQLLLLIDSAKVRGFDKSNAQEIHVKVSAEAALGVAAPGLTKKFIGKLPTGKEGRTSAIVTLESPEDLVVKIKVADVFDSYERAGIDLFDGAVKLEDNFRAATVTGSIRGLNAEVEIAEPPAETVVDGAAGETCATDAA